MHMHMDMRTSKHTDRALHAFALHAHHLHIPDMHMHMRMCMCPALHSMHTVCTLYLAVCRAHLGLPLSLRGARRSAQDLRHWRA